MLPPPDCMQARESISTQLDGELSELGSARLSAHLRDCASCSAYALDAAAITTRLRTAPLEQPSLRIALPRRRRRPGFQVAAAAAAVVAVAAASSLAIQQSFGSPRGPAGTTGAIPDVVGL